MRRRRLPGHVLSPWLFAASALAQGDTTPPPPQPAVVPASSLLLQLGQAGTDLATARRIAGDLHDRPITVRMQLFDTLGKRYLDAGKAFARDRDAVQKRMQKAVPQAQRKNLGKGGAAEVDELRQKARAITQSPDLSKQRIHDELDPMRARLFELVLPTPAQVLAAEPSLGEALDALRAELDVLHGWFDLYLDVRRSLDEDLTGRRHVDKQKEPAEPPPFSAPDDDLAHQCLFALPLDARDQKALADNEALRPGMEPEEYAGTLELNRIRIALGLGAVRIDEKLAAAARDHSHDMQTLGFFSHTSPVDGKHSFGDRAARQGTSASAENIAAGQSTGAGAIEAWWYSPGHHKNMLGGHARTGLGRCEGLWTQMFGG